MSKDKPLLPIARAAERRLVRLHVWAELRRQITRVAGAAAFSAVLRPLVWPLHHEAPSHSVLRALGFAAGGAAIATAVILVRAWRSRPSLLTATRAVDKALGLAEVVASGVAFEQNGRDDEMAAFAIDRARRAAAEVNVKRLLVSEPVTQPRFFKLMIAVACAGVLFGAVDRIVIDRAIHPVTASETKNADSLAELARKTADQAKVDAANPITPEEQRMLEAAQRAVDRAKRGDREGAMEALEDMKKAQRELDAQDRDRSQQLRTLRDELSSKGANASEAAEQMQKELAEAKTPEETKALAERLAKAAEAAKSASEKSASAREKGAWERASEALKEANEAAERGDSEAAKQALARAQKEISSIERGGARSRRSSLSKLGAQASALDRSLRAGAEGKQAGEGKDPGEGSGQSGKGEDGKGKGDKGDKADKSDGEPGGPGGGGDTDDRPIAPRERIKMNGDLQVRSDVREGEKAVSAIEGVGRGDDPKAFKDIFPSYDTVVEDGLREDNVPAARRPTVRRYFKSIRPGEETK